MAAATPTSDPSFFTRVALAFSLFFRVLFNALFAGQVQRLSRGAAVPEALPAPEPEAEAAPVPKLREAPTDAALQLLGLLQREGRFVDFLLEDMTGYADADIGAAARVVHDQCRKAVEAHVKLERIRPEAEGSRVSVAPGFAASEIRLTGQVAGTPPFAGTLTHAGWRALNVELPKLTDGHDVRVIAPAEVEL